MNEIKLNTKWFKVDMEEFQLSVVQKK